MEYKTKLLSQSFNENVALNVYIGSALLHRIITFVSFHTALGDQPWCDYFLCNKALILGYGLFFFGLGLKIYTICSYGWSRVIGVMFFKRSSKITKADIVKLYLEPYYHPNGTAAIIFLVSIALLRASLAGIVVCVIFAIAYVLAYHTEKFLLQADWSSFMQKSQFTKIKAIRNRFIEVKGFKQD